MKARETSAQAAQRWKRLHVLQEHYRHFEDFLEDVMAELGFVATDIQKEIGAWMEHGPTYLMVQAQRGQAKTTVAAAFAVWCLIHSPAHRVLILSAAGTQANEISTLIVRLILSMDVLECMRPDRQAGDRESTEAFDVHHSLKGLDKSPSVACIGIDGNLQGKRADLLIADDIESGKNSATAQQRAKIAHITKDFTSICSTGRIIWLGTPQTMESIYNALPARGVAIRIWPGRYPTPKQREFYGTNLAPSIVRALAADPSLATGGGLLGDQGKPIDPVILDEDTLRTKELDQGEAYFQLQHMLNTTLSDAMRFPLKPDKLVVIPSPGGRYPLAVTRGLLDTHLRDFVSADHAFRMRVPGDVSQDTAALQSSWAYIDPAAGGANADETAWAIGGFLNGNVYVQSVGGIPGGYDLEKLEVLAKHIARFKPTGVTIEKNMGYGAFAAVFLPILRQYMQCQIEEDLVTGQKEARIIATLAPVMGRGSLIFEEDVVAEDEQWCRRYDAAQRPHYSLFYQLAKMTSARGALPHDDRADALEGLVRHYTEALAKDQNKEIEALRRREHEKAMRDPLQHQRFKKSPVNKFGSLLKRRR